MRVKDIDNMWSWLIEKGVATYQELQLITDINGYKMQTLNDVLYARTGYRDREQYEDAE